MKKLLRVLLWGFVATIALVVGLAALFVYLAYTPPPEVPQLTGTLARGSVQVGELTRSYLTYVPRGLPTGAPLVIVMHGSGLNGARMRFDAGYGFDRLADEHGFAVAYPNAYDGYWDACAIVGKVNVSGLDDVAFLTRLADKLAGDIGIDPNRVFATGASRGGSMALRLALEAPSRFRAVAAISGSVPAPENFKCTPGAQGTSSVMIMNGTEDPIVPFDGGNVSLFGLFYRNGKVRSARESAQYFAELNHLGAPQTAETSSGSGIRVERVLWRGSAKEVELVAIHGGGHGIPQPYRRNPRILGPSVSEPNGPAVIWEFFARQPR